MRITFHRMLYNFYSKHFSIRVIIKNFVDGRLGTLNNSKMEIKQVDEPHSPNSALLNLPETLPVLTQIIIISFIILPLARSCGLQTANLVSSKHLEQKLSYLHSSKLSSFTVIRTHLYTCAFLMQKRQELIIGL